MVNLYTLGALIAGAPEPTPTGNGNNLTTLTNIRPTFGAVFPFMTTFIEWVADFQGLILILCGVALLIGICMFSFGRVAGSHKMQQVGVGALVVGVVAGILSGSVWYLIGWGGTQVII